MSDVKKNEGGKNDLRSAVMYQWRALADFKAAHNDSLGIDLKSHKAAAEPGYKLEIATTGCKVCRSRLELLEWQSFVRCIGGLELHF